MADTGKSKSAGGKTNPNGKTAGKPVGEKQSRQNELSYEELSKIAGGAIKSGDPCDGGNIARH